MTGLLSVEHSAGIRWENWNLNIWPREGVFEYSNNILIRVGRNRFFEKRKKDVFAFKLDLLYLNQISKNHVRLFAKI